MSVEAERSHRAEHRLTLCGRESLEVRGVTDVANFDEQTVVLNTLCGGMEIEGNALHIHVLNTEEGVVTLDGKIDSISYFDQESDQKDGKSGFFGRLFR